MPISECQWFGVAMVMASTSGEASRTRMSVNFSGMVPSFASSAAVLSSTAVSTSQIAAIRTPARARRLAR